MTTGVHSVFRVVATHASADMDTHLQRMTSHHEQATRLHDQATVRVPGELSYATHWESPEALRTWSNEQHQADLCQQAMHNSARIIYRAMCRAYAHICLCKVRGIAETVTKSLHLSLAQVRDLFTTPANNPRHAPPLVFAPDVLATCHASNAPGLSGIAMRHWQAQSTE